MFKNIKKLLKPEQHKYVQKFSSIGSFNIDSFLNILK